MNSEPEHRIRRGGSIASSGLLTALVLALLLGGIGLFWSAHLGGRLHKIGNVEIPPDTSQLPRPGGQDLLDLHRLTGGAGLAPQFTGLSMMPGVGMGVLQLTLDQPGREPHGILVATPIEKLNANLEPVTNLPKSSLQFSAFSVTLPNGGGRELLGRQPATQVHNNMLPGGTGATAVFAADPPPGPDGVTPPRSPLETTVYCTVSERGLDVTVTAKNVSDEPQTPTIAWSPRFAVPAAGLDRLHIIAPETDAARGGERGEIVLPNGGFHREWRGLRHAYLSAGPEIQLRNLADGYTLKMTALAPSIHSVTVDAASGQEGGVVFAFSTEGATTPDAPIGPGESLQWHLRIQVMANGSYTTPRL